MPDYKLYHLDRSGQIAGAPEQFEAETDEAALAEATQRMRSAGELWEGRRLVKRLSALT